MPKNEHRDNTSTLQNVKYSLYFKRKSFHNAQKIIELKKQNPLWIFIKTVLIFFIGILCWGIYRTFPR